MMCRTIYACALAAAIVFPMVAHAQSSNTVLVPDPYANDPESQRERSELYANSYDSYVAPDEHMTKREREAHPKAAARASADAASSEAQAEAKANAAAAARGN